MSDNNFEFNDFKKSDKKYVPTESLHNHHRHFGTIINNKIMFDLEELLYLFNKPEIKDYKIYYTFKNNNYNLRRKEDSSDEYLIFIKHKNFNRKKDNPIAICKNVCKEDVFINKIDNLGELFYIFRVESEEEVCFLKVEQIDKLEKTIEEKDKKN